MTGDKQQKKIAAVLERIHAKKVKQAESVFRLSQ